MYVNRCNLRRQKCDKKKRSREDFEIQRPYNTNTVHVESINKCDTSNNRGDLNYFKVIQKIHEQHTGKLLSQGAAENSHIGHCTHTPASANVKVQ
jgi:hypothetical protein